MTHVMPIISRSELAKVKSREGLYSQLNRPTKPTTAQKEINNLIETVVEIVEKSFKAYARAHGCKPQNIEMEWQRMLKFLKENL